MEGPEVGNHGSPRWRLVVPAILVLFVALAFFVAISLSGTGLGSSGP